MKFLKLMWKYHKAQYPKTNAEWIGFLVCVVSLMLLYLATK